MCLTSSWSTSRLQTGQDFSSGNSKCMTPPNSSTTVCLGINQYLCVQSKWNRWKHLSILTKSTLSENLASCSSSPQRSSMQMAHVPFTVSLNSDTISLIYSCKSNMMPESSSSSFLVSESVFALYRKKRVKNYGSIKGSNKSIKDHFYEQ